MKPGQKNSYNSLKSIIISGKDYKYYSLLEAEKNGLRWNFKTSKIFKSFIRKFIKI